VPRNRRGFAVLILILVSAPANADRLDVLQGKFAFDWYAEPSGEKCIRIVGQLLADLKSTRYRCDLKAKSNTSTGASARTCTEVNGRKEYLIFDTLRACESERETQASNE
jgi:hypothetical protein